MTAVGLLAIFHIPVLLGVVPADIVWGGMIQGGQTKLVTLESIALLITLLFMLIIAAKIAYTHAGKLPGAVNIGVPRSLAFGF